MVNMQRVQDRVLKGLYVGVGSFSASFVGGLIEDNLDVGDLGASAGQVAVGLGVSVGVDEVFTSPQSMPNDFFEYMGYGVQGAGWSNLGQSLSSGTTTGQNIVRVRDQGTSNDSGTSQQSASFSLEA